MKAILLATAALATLAIAPASAQMAPMMGGTSQSCVSGGQFVPCGQPMMGSGPGMSDGAMMDEKPMRRRSAKRMRRQAM